MSGTETKADTIRIHAHFGRIVLNNADGYLTIAQAEGLARELKLWAAALAYGKHPNTRLVKPNGSRCYEASGQRAWRGGEG